MRQLQADPCCRYPRAPMLAREICSKDPLVTECPAILRLELGFNNPKRKKPSEEGFLGKLILNDSSM
jgi:hypothetical protein